MRTILGSLLLTYSAAFVTLASATKQCTVLTSSIRAHRGLEFAVNYSSSLEATEGFFKRLRCRSFNFCRITWFFNDQPYGSWDLHPRFNDYFLDATNETLSLKSVYSDAGGNYTCLVTNGNTTIRRDFHVVVIDPVWNNKPVILDSHPPGCENKTAVIGGNVSFYCRFYIGNAEFEATSGWWKHNDTKTAKWRYNIVNFINVSRSNFTTSHALETNGSSSKKGTVLGTQMNITNVTEAAFGIYQVRCTLPSYQTRYNLTLTLAHPPLKVTDNTPIIITASVLFGVLALSVLLWKRVGVDVKLLYHDHLSSSKEDDSDSKMYDAYISSSCYGDDRAFVYNILYPALKDRYKVFLQERDTLPGGDHAGKIVDAMTKSRRCIVVLSPDFNRPSSPGFTNWGPMELQHAHDLMRSHRLHIIPIIYRDFDINSLDSSDDVMKLITNVIENVPCLHWDQVGSTRVDTRAIKQLRLRLPPRRPKQTSSSSLSTTSSSSSISPSSLSSSSSSSSAAAASASSASDTPPNSPTYTIKNNNTIFSFTKYPRRFSRRKQSDTIYLIDNDTELDNMTVDTSSCVTVSAREFRSCGIILEQNTRNREYDWI